MVQLRTNNRESCEDDLLAKFSFSAMKVNNVYQEENFHEIKLNCEHKGGDCGKYYSWIYSCY